MQPAATANLDASLVVNGGSFVVVDTNTALVSSDGVTWTSSDVTGLVSSRYVLEGLNGLWSRDTTGGVDTTLRYSLDGATWEDVTIIAGLEIVDLAGGPTGLAALAEQLTQDQPTTQQWVGWSTDGSNWQWQPAVDAFVSGDAQLAVGTKGAIALVDRSRWFSTNR